MINKWQQLKSKTKLNFCEIICDFNDELNYRRQSGFVQVEVDSFAQNAQGRGFLHHESLFLMMFIRRKPQVKNMITSS